ncbi:hypothetical protein COU58_00315 [Candidatus Pacearchaeota archaeon CG10_big_fil_rev_8_21_14_0_10_32_42]|nr:MAG: hypothetical protein COU58_00315 [Candidatus Pacearchaeota archaeon CG10_big_fil_rev_8_21_14_0_10_32_42]
MQKKGSMEISFGMIFSIILIVVFLGFAFYAIQKFLGMQNEVTTAKFYESLSNDVQKVWVSDDASKQVEYHVPSKINQICFDSDSEENVYLRSGNPLPGRYIEHLFIESNGCFPVKDGKVKLTLEKTYGENFVTVSD